MRESFNNWYYLYMKYYSKAMKILSNVFLGVIFYGYCIILPAIIIGYKIA